jgi:sigma-B regulation protein RsbU (phosphoserine phosphatase)
MGLFSRAPKEPPKAPAQATPPGGLPAQAPSPKTDVLFQDLAAGAEYQRALCPPAPEVPGYDLGVVYRGARQISGDFYDFLPGEGRIGLAIGDASGKGIPASLLTVTVKALLRAQPEKDAPPARVLGNVNRMLQGNIKRGMFLSGAFCVLDTSWHSLTIANAGHLPTIVWRSKLKIANVYPSKGPVLGVVDPDAFDAQMKEEVITLEPGDRFVLITDGVNEAMAPGQKEFGMEHLRKRLQAESDGKSADFLKHVVDQIDIHRAGGEQSDDITIVTGRRVP